MVEDNEEQTGETGYSPRVTSKGFEIGTIHLKKFPPEGIVKDTRLLELCYYHRTYHRTYHFPV